MGSYLINMDHSYIDENVARVRERIAQSARRAGRNAEEITLLAAIKSADTDEVNHLHKALGINDVGENRVQQLTERYEKLDREGLNMHFIGSLQTNKVKYIIDRVSLIHSLDSMRLAEEIQKQAEKRGMTSRVLVEINSGGEDSKGGIEPADAERFCIDLQRFDNIELCGFMTMAPRCDRKEDYFPYFESTRDIGERIWHSSLGRCGSPILSMGMSESFEAAVECGATIVRVGRTLFARKENTEI